MTSELARWRFKSPASRLFTQPFIRAQIKENIKAPRHWPFFRGIHRGPVNSPHKGPVTRKMFSFDDVIMRILQGLRFECTVPWVRILHSAEEDNLSPFDSNIACLCQGIEINNNKHVYRQSQVRTPTGSEVEWAECLLIIGTGCRVQVFSLILDRSVGLSAGIQSAGE